jgi:tetratricopeptide (TPR) repeat protein
LRLAIGRDGIGLELATSAFLECIVVEELTTSLPGTRFPVDVSGGVARFRHRRGALQTLRLVVLARAVERWVTPRLRGVVSATSPDVWIRVGPARATVCVAAHPEEEGPAAQPPDAASGVPAVVAFDVLAVAEGNDLQFVVTNARGAGLPAPPTAIAMACVAAAFGRAADRTGAIFRIRRPAEAAARALLPEAGARVPAADGVCWSAFSVDGDAWVLTAARGSPPAEPATDAVRAREIAVLLGAADDALFRGDLDGARAGYLGALERAPRHAEIARRIADVDARAPGRAEAALAALAEAAQRETVFPVEASLVEAELLVRAGDTDAAIARLERGGSTEPAPVLAARSFEMAARLAADPEVQAMWLDRALARSPRVVSARWARVRARLALGRLEDGLADVEFLEALARGRAAKCAVWHRAGQAWQAAGLGEQAGGIFERALRYEPDDPTALMGLGTALAAGGRPARGVALLERALEIASAHGEKAFAIEVALARALADHLDDLPAAIAHANTVPSDAPEGAVARGLEARWRSRIGDTTGAALAFARLRDLATSRAPTGDAAAAREIVAFLAEAARFETDVRHDPLAAQRHLAAAIRLDPHDTALRQAYRAAGERRIGAGRPGDDHGFEREAPGDGTPPALPSARAEVDNSLQGFGDDPAGAARIDDLTRRLQAVPTDSAVADELVRLLEDFGRGHELVALLGARLDEATPDQRPEIVERATTSLHRLLARAMASGRDELAALCRDALAAFAPDEVTPPRWSR